MKNRVQQGSSLVEVLVALFVLAIGLLGTLAMQTKSMQFNQAAHNYSKAVYIATDIAERMKTHGKLQQLNSGLTGGIAGGDGFVPSVAGFELKRNEDAPTGASTADCDNANACGLAAIVARDKAVIFESLQKLPRGDIAITPVAGQQDMADITIYFVESTVNIENLADSKNAVQTYTRRVKI